MNGAILSLLGLLALARGMDYLPEEAEEMEFVLPHAELIPDNLFEYVLCGLTNCISLEEKTEFVENVLLEAGIDVRVRQPRAEDWGRRDFMQRDRDTFTDMDKPPNYERRPAGQHVTGRQPFHPQPVYYGTYPIKSTGGAIIQNYKGDVGEGTEVSRKSRSLNHRRRSSSPVRSLGPGSLQVGGIPNEAEKGLGGAPSYWTAFATEPLEGTLTDEKRPGTSSGTPLIMVSSGEKKANVAQKESVSFLSSSTSSEEEEKEPVFTPKARTPELGSILRAKQPFTPNKQNTLFRDERRPVYGERRNIESPRQTPSQLPEKQRNRSEPDRPYRPSMGFEGHQGRSNGRYRDEEDCYPRGPMERRDFDPYGEGKFDQAGRKRDAQREALEANPFLDDRSFHMFTSNPDGILYARQHLAPFVRAIVDYNLLAKMLILMMEKGHQDSFDFLHLHLDTLLIDDETLADLMKAAVKSGVTCFTAILKNPSVRALQEASKYMVVQNMELYDAFVSAGQDKIPQSVGKWLPATEANKELALYWRSPPNKNAVVQHETVNLLSSSKATDVLLSHVTTEIEIHAIMSKELEDFCLEYLEPIHVLIDSFEPMNDDPSNSFSVFHLDKLTGTVTILESSHKHRPVFSVCGGHEDLTVETEEMPSGMVVRKFNLAAGKTIVGIPASIVSAAGVKQIGEMLAGVKSGEDARWAIFRTCEAVRYSQHTTVLVGTQAEQKVDASYDDTEYGDDGDNSFQELYDPEETGSNDDPAQYQSSQGSGSDGDSAEPELPEEAVHNL